MSVPTDQTKRPLVAEVYAAVSGLVGRLKTDAGWRRLRFAGIATTALGLVADFVKPVVWVVPPVTILTILALVASTVSYWWLRRSGNDSRLWLPARTTIISAIGVVVFGAVWSAQAAVPSNETITGQLLRTALELQNSMKGLEEKVEQVGQEVGHVRVLMEEGAARDALKRAQETRDYADYGQVVAIESILGGGGNLARAALSGLDLNGINLSGAMLPEAKIVFSRLGKANLAESNLSGAWLTLSTLDGAELRGADLTDAQLELMTADSASFEGVKGDDANFLAARLQQAKFVGASLRRARFAFADLTGADFTDADLTDALFIGAKIDGAVFNGAILANTDLTGIADPPATLIAAGDGRICRTHGTDGKQGVQVLVIERIPSSRFQGGIEYYRLFEDWFYYDATVPADLPACASRAFAEDWDFPIWRYENRDNLSGNFGISFSQEFLAAGARRRELVTRIRRQFLGKSE